MPWQHSFEQLESFVQPRRGRRMPQELPHLRTPRSTIANDTALFVPGAKCARRRDEILEESCFSQGSSAYGAECQETPARASSFGPTQGFPLYVGSAFALGLPPWNSYGSVTAMRLFRAVHIKCPAVPAERLRMFSCRCGNDEFSLSSLPIVQADRIFGSEAL